MAGLHLRAHFLLGSQPFSGELPASSSSSLHLNATKHRALECKDSHRPWDHLVLDTKRNVKAFAGINVIATPTLSEHTVSDNDEVCGEVFIDSEEHSTDEELGSEFEMFVPPGAILSEGKTLKRLPGSNIYVGPFAKNSKVKSAKFVKSSKHVNDCPELKLPEFAMIGRSNVGKSSLINSLVQRKDLAQTSKKPGKTQLINHFIINDSWYLVDLPGYGYAKVPQTIRSSWDGFTKEFFHNSKSLVCVNLLVDASLPPQTIDLEYATWLHKKKVAFTIVFTKCDRKKKVKNGGRKPIENLKDFLTQLKDYFHETPAWIMTSCVTNQGKDALLIHMSQLRNYWKN